MGKDTLMKYYPSDIQEFVKKISGEQYDEKLPLIFQFTFNDQPEGWEFWWEIANGDLDLFYTKYPKEQEKEKESPIERLTELNEDCNWKTWSSTPGGNMFLDEFIGSLTPGKIEIDDIEVKEPEIVSDSIVAKVIDSFKERSNVGIKKYGVTLDRGDLSFLEWLNHSQQEAMDMILYLERMKSTKGMSYSFDLDEIDTIKMKDEQIIITTKNEERTK